MWNLFPISSIFKAYIFLTLMPEIQFKTLLWKGQKVKYILDDVDTANLDHRWLKDADSWKLAVLCGQTFFGTQPYPHTQIILVPHQSKSEMH